MLILHNFLQTYIIYDKIYSETKEAMYITKNSVNDLVVLSDEAYEKLIKYDKEVEGEGIARTISDILINTMQRFMSFKNKYLKK